MAEKYKVIQWATGVVGLSALKGIARHPKLELVACKVYSDDKAGRDAGEIAGIGPLGVTATQDVDAIVATEADCVLYCPLPWHTEEICRLLETGKHVITPCPYWFPFLQNPETAEAIQKSCEAGGVSFHASGCNPGGIAERFPLTFTGWCNRIDRITHDRVRRVHLLQLRRRDAEPDEPGRHARAGRPQPDQGRAREELERAHRHDRRGPGHARRRVRGSSTTSSWPPRTSRRPSASSRRTRSR